MLSIHPRNGISETPASAKAVFDELNKISTAFNGIEEIVGNMSPEGQKRVIIESKSFIKASRSYYATMKRLGLDE